MKRAFLKVAVGLSLLTLGVAATPDRSMATCNNATCGSYDWCGGVADWHCSLDDGGEYCEATTCGTQLQ